jgi:outer membrane protein assembly factor BamB
MPETPVIANGVVFALSAGEPKLKGKEKGQPGGHAILYGLDAETGKEIYSTGDQVTAPANLSGVTMANGRVFFSTTDGTLYAFGYHLEH